MKNITQILAAFFLITIASACITSSKEKKTNEKESCCQQEAKAETQSCCSLEKKEKSCCSDSKVANADVQAYYFHATRRCATCEAVEKVTAETILENFKDKVAFVSINREENKDNPLLEKYKVDGQTLILVKGDKVENLTTNAFLNARSNPEKFEEKLISTIQSMLN